MTRVRVLELIKSLDIGGAEKLLVERLAMTSHTEFDVRVAFLDPSRRTLVPSLEALGVPVTCLGASRRTSSGWLLRLRRSLIQSPVDVVHVHSPLMAVGVRIVLKSLGRRAPALVSTEHSVNYHFATQWLNKLTIGRDDRVVAVSKAVARGAVARRSEHVTIIHHGVNLERIQLLRENRERLSEMLELPYGPLVVTVANYRVEKDLATLVAAAELVIERIPEVHFLLVGDGPQVDSLTQSIAERQLASNVHLLGQIDDAVRVTACADVFALTSVREGLPVAVMEALACGVPVVATDVGGLRELIVDGKSGFITALRAPEQTAARLISLLSNPDLLVELGSGALSASRAFDMARTTKEIERLYLALAHTRNLE